MYFDLDSGGYLYCVSDARYYWFLYFSYSEYITRGTEAFDILGRRNVASEPEALNILGRYDILNIPTVGILYEPEPSMGEFANST